MKMKEELDQCLPGHLCACDWAAISAKTKSWVPSTTIGESTLGDKVKNAFVYTCCKESWACWCQPFALLIQCYCYGGNVMKKETQQQPSMIVTSTSIHQRPTRKITKPQHLRDFV